MVVEKGYDMSLHRNNQQQKFTTIIKTKFTVKYNLMKVVTKTFLIKRKSASKDIKHISLHRNTKTKGVATGNR